MVSWEGLLQKGKNKLLRLGYKKASWLLRCSTRYLPLLKPVAAASTRLFVDLVGGFWSLVREPAAGVQALLQDVILDRSGPWGNFRDLVNAVRFQEVVGKYHRAQQGTNL